MPQTFLEKVLKVKRKEVERKKEILPLERLKKRIKKAPSVRDFKKSVFCRTDDKVSIIAEIKRFSPSGGVLREKLSSSLMAKTYQENGASAISVLIDKNFFGGGLKDLIRVKKSSSLPVLAKEFIIDEYQIFEARICGADCILLIARILDKKKLSYFYNLAKELGMSCIVEVHSEKDVEKISFLPSFSIVGINTRDLDSLKVDLTFAEKLLNFLSPSYLIIGESGIKDLKDIRYLKKKGIRAFLIGEAILRSSNPGLKLMELCSG